MRKKIVLFVVAALVISITFLAAGCSSTKEVTANNDQEILTKAAADYFNNLQEGHNMISAEKVAEQLDDLYIIDVRRADDFAKNKIPNSVNILMEDIGGQLDKLPKNKTIVVVCYIGQMSSQTIGVLRMAGFDAVAMSGGFPSWEKLDNITQQPEGMNEPQDSGGM